MRRMLDRVAVMGAVAIALVVSGASPGGSQGTHHGMFAAPEDASRLSPCGKAYAAPALDPQIRKVPWKVSTASADAQAYFEQGVTLLYGFNYEDSLRNFRQAKKLDPTLAMASWGIAMAAGPNINLGMDPTCERLANDESAAALALAEQQRPAGTITELEYALVRALPPRYARSTAAPAYATAKRAVDYAVGMRSVWDRFKPNENVGALYAESLMDLRPWMLFNVAQQPALDTHEVLDVLQTSLNGDRSAVGANHYWIHAVEAGPAPGSAKSSADLLRTRVPASGHLLHMPSHTYMLIGEYEQAYAANEPAIRVDREQFATACAGTYAQYAASPGCLQLYYGHYLSHNLFFRSVAAAFAGKSAASVSEARATRAHAERFVVNEPGLQRYMTAPLMMEVAHHQWTAVLNEPEPPESCYVQPPFTHHTGCRILRSIYHWARGTAFAARGRSDEARAEYGRFTAERDRITPGSDRSAPDPIGWGNNSAAAVLAIAQETLLARIAWAEGKRDEAISHLRLGVSNEDALAYDEPPQWVHPVRQSLGGALLAMHRYRDAADAFQADLRHHVKNGRSLYGLYRTQEAMGDPRWQVTKAEYAAAWRGADYAMDDAKLW
jgi:tetratricopeptide (TPR) repeat protein